MKPFTVKALLLATLLLPAGASAKAPKASDSQRDSLKTLRESRLVSIPERSIAIVDVKTPRCEIGRKLDRVKSHPGLDSLLIHDPELECKILTEINRRCDESGKDSLLTSELFYVMRPYFDALHHEDPHYRIDMWTFADYNVYPKQSQVRKLSKKIPAPGFNLLNVNDTLIIDRSFDSQFQRGDQVTAINGVPAAEYLKYGYGDRHMTPSYLMNRCHFGNIVDHFRIGLQRNGEFVEIETSGMPVVNTSFRLRQAEETDRNIRTYADAKTGYIALPEFFFNNSRLIRIVRDAILDFKAQGITNVVLDLRRNPGGYGHAFDELLSIFIDKPRIDYCTGQRVKVTESALESYKFLTEEQLGQVVEMPETEILKSFPAIAKMYIPAMTYYVLTGRDTGSIAASFVNMLQYHGAAKLVGEPLRHNALKYGEEDQGKTLQSTLLFESSVSLIQIDELTRRDDGYVMPDIPIPAVAAEYLTGRDAVLEKLLEYIKSSIDGNTTALLRE